METKESSKNNSVSWKVIKWIMFVVFALYAASLLFPLFFALLSSLRSREAYNAQHFSFNGIIGFGNYVSAFRYLPMETSSGEKLTILSLIWNSLWYTVGGCGLQLIASCMTAYIVAKYKFKGRGVIYAVALLSLTLPIVGQIPSQYKIYRALHILNSPAILISFFNGFGFNFLILYSCFRNISWDYAEAAFIDGAGHFRVFLQIILPHAVATMGALFMMTCVNYWNDYLGPILFLGDYPTLASGLYEYRVLSIRNQAMGGVSTPIMFAGMLVSLVPIMTLYALFNKKMIELNFSGGLKG